MGENVTWWYENEEEKMELYKNEDLCIECKNEFFSKPYDHRDPTPGQLGYCIKCDNCLIKEKKMEFLRERVYTALNADELKQGDKVITARCMADLKTWVEADAEPNIIELIQDETNTDRFTCKCHGSNKTYDSPLAYLVERAENCTNCENKDECPDYLAYFKNDGVRCRCEEYKPKTELFGKTEQMKHYRPFKSAKELVDNVQANYTDVTLPYIWVKGKKASVEYTGWLVTGIGYDGVALGDTSLTWEDLFNNYTFLDGSVCGVEE